MKLIKLTDDHYVVVNDSEIKEGDWYIDDTLQILQALPPKKDWINSGKNGYIICKKITHSSQPLEYIEDKDEFGTHKVQGFDKIQYLPLQELKELIGEVDVEKKARKVIPTPMSGTEYIDEIKGFVKGYNQALEDNKEKKYTEEDMRVAIRLATTSKYDHKLEFYSEEEVLKSLQPKTEWEVEIVDGKLKLK